MFQEFVDSSSADFSLRYQSCLSFWVLWNFPENPEIYSKHVWNGISSAVSTMLSVNCLLFYSVNLVFNCLSIFLELPRTFLRFQTWIASKFSYFFLSTPQLSRLFCFRTPLIPERSWPTHIVKFTGHLTYFLVGGGQRTHWQSDVWTSNDCHSINVPNYIEVFHHVHDYVCRRSRK